MPQELFSTFGQSDRAYTNESLLSRVPEKSDGMFESFPAAEP